MPRSRGRTGLDPARRSDRVRRRPTGARPDRPPGHSSARQATAYPWAHHIGDRGGTQPMTARHWGAAFDADELGRLETRMWKAYYRKQPARLFGLLVQAVRAQAGVSWPRAIAGSVLLTKAAAG